MKIQALALIPALLLALLAATSTSASELKGPGRFCGYSPIIDLLPGETVTVLDGGIHGGSFRWEGVFGALEVRGIGWASRPKGKIIVPKAGAKPARFAERKVEGRYQIAIWNGENAAAYFSSDLPITRRQLAAIDRVTLYSEGEEPTGCKLRTMFSWG